RHSQAHSHGSPADAALPPCFHSPLRRISLLPPHADTTSHLHAARTSSAPPLPSLAADAGPSSPPHAAFTHREPHHAREPAPGTSDQAASRRRRQSTDDRGKRRRRRAQPSRAGQHEVSAIAGTCHTHAWELHWGSTPTHFDGGGVADPVVGASDPLAVGPDLRRLGPHAPPGHGSFVPSQHQVDSPRRRLPCRSPGFWRPPRATRRRRSRRAGAWRRRRGEPPSCRAGATQGERFLTFRTCNIYTTILKT
ncbi:unnamed protein product, partial [Urochloa humidicola]